MRSERGARQGAGERLASGEVPPGAPRGFGESREPRPGVAELACGLVTWPGGGFAPPGRERLRAVSAGILPFGFKGRMLSPDPVRNSLGEEAEGWGGRLQEK